MYQNASIPACLWARVGQLLGLPSPVRALVTTRPMFAYACYTRMPCDVMMALAIVVISANRTEQSLKLSFRAIPAS